MKPLIDLEAEALEVMSYYRISSIIRPGLLFFEEGWTPGLLFGHGPLFEHGSLYFHRHIAGNGGF